MGSITGSSPKIFAYLHLNNMFSSKMRMLLFASVYVLHEKGGLTNSQATRISDN
jgi:hypothetical protein